MFLLNVCLILLMNLMCFAFCPSFATHNTPASLSSILMYQIRFPPPHPDYSIFNFPTPLFYWHSRVDQSEYAKQNFILMFTFSILDLFCKFCPKINLPFWCCLIDLPVFQSERLEASGFSCYTPKLLKGT